MSRVRKLQFAALAATVLLAMAGGGFAALASDSSTSKIASGNTDTIISDDDKAIRAQASQYAQAFATGDSATLANMWTADGLMTDVNGCEYKGRTQIQAQFASHFRQFGPHKLDISVQSIKFPAPNVAIEEGTSRCIVDGIPLEANRYLATLVKQNGQWQLAAVGENRWTPETSYAALKDLSWMIGKWSVKQPTSTGVGFNAEWVANRNFLKCEFVENKAADNNADPIKTTNIIGWDPIAKQIVSWHFDSTGGFGYGRWHKQGSTWVVEANGVEPDGSAANASYVLNPVDINMFTWQSTARQKDGRRLPDMPSISIGRDESVQ